MLTVCTNAVLWYRAAQLQGDVNERIGCLTASNTRTWGRSFRALSGTWRANACSASSTSCSFWTPAALSMAATSASIPDSGLNFAVRAAVVEVLGISFWGPLKTRVGASRLTRTMEVHFVTSFLVSSYLKPKQAAKTGTKQIQLCKRHKLVA